MKPLVLTILFCIVFWPLESYSQEIEELKQNLNIAVLEKDTLDMSRLWYRIGRYYDQHNQSVKSNHAIMQALVLAKNINNYSAISSIANYLASNYSLESKSDSAIYYYNVAIEACTAEADSTKLAGILINLGDEYATRGNYLEAANHALLSIKIKESLGDSTNLAYFYQKVGEIYKLAGEEKKWEEYIQKAYQLIRFEKFASLSAVASTYNDLGGIAESKGEYQQALSYYDTLISLGKDKNFVKAVGVALSNSAMIYKLLGNIDKALETAIESQEYRNHTDYQRIYDNNLLAELLLMKHKIANARKYAQLAIGDENIDGYPDEKMRGFKILYEIEKKDKNFEKALFWNENFKQLSDSLRNKEIRTQILDLEISYETEKKEQQIELLTTENKLKNQRINAGIGVVAALLLVILLIVYILNIRKKQAQLKQNDLQQQVLRAQMNPHFVFNVLGSIQNFMMQNDTRKASNFLAQFASLTRATLNNSVAETISLADEINMLRNYIELEKMRKADKFDFEIQFDDELEIDFIKIPPMLIQPFIENAIKHGFKNIEHKGFLRLQITDKTNWVEFIVEDNGNGISKMEKEKNGHQSMAMNIFEKRRKLIQQKYKKNFKFDLRNLNETNPKLSGVKITIGIPILNND